MEQLEEVNPILCDALCNTAAGVRTIDDFKQWSRDCIRPLLPHESLLCGLGRLHAGGVSLDYLIGVDYPVGHIEAIRNRVDAIDTPILRRWLAVQEPLIFEEASPWPEVPEKWLASFRRHELRNCVAHALADADRCVGTYHSFHRIPGSPGPRHIAVLRQLVPLLHQVVCTIIENLNATNHGAEEHPAALLAILTEREREVLRLLMLGKTNSEIARLAAMSENTVKHHLTSSFSKLQVKNRTQLVHRLAVQTVRPALSQGTQVL